MPRKPKCECGKCPTCFRRNYMRERRAGKPRKECVNKDERGYRRIRDSIDIECGPSSSSSMIADLVELGVSGDGVKRKYRTASGD